ncbi:MAG: ATPase [Pseudomonadota bacterium]
MQLGVRGAELSDRRAIPVPALPHTIEDTGLEPGFLGDLLIKTTYRTGLERPSEMARALKLPSWIVDQLIENAKAKKLMEALGQLGASMAAEMRYTLTAKGKEFAVEALALSDWTGAAPVPLEHYVRQLTAQSILGEVLTRPRLERVFKELTLSEMLMEQVGPAVNSGASMLLYGPPGNGKSSIAVAVCAAFQDHIFLPYAIEVDKQVITLFDPAVHARMDREGEEGSGLRREGGFDPRYVRCKRPIVITGGELTLDMLDLAYNPVSRVYEAPMQMKASGGILVVDDFGRQRQSPQELINRLIIPLENKLDYLSLQTGRKFEAPFDALVIFSTNIAPKQLVDDAALRRLRYKILVDKPDRDTYIRIFAKTAAKFDLRLDEETLAFILVDLYGKTPGAEFHAFHPKFLIEQTLAICSYEGVERQLTAEYLRRAWRNLFTEH